MWSCRRSRVYIAWRVFVFRILMVDLIMHKHPLHHQHHQHSIDTTCTSKTTTSPTDPLVHPITPSLCNYPLEIESMAMYEDTTLITTSPKPEWTLGEDRNEPWLFSHEHQVGIIFIIHFSKHWMPSPVIITLLQI